MMVMVAVMVGVVAAPCHPRMPRPEIMCNRIKPGRLWELSIRLLLLRPCSARSNRVVAEQRRPWLCARLCPHAYAHAYAHALINLSRPHLVSHLACTARAQACVPMSAPMPTLSG